MSKKYTGVVSFLLAVALLVFLTVTASSQAAPQNQSISEKSMSQERYAEELVELEEKMEEYGFDKAGLNKVRDMLEDSRKKGLPQAPLVNKVYEGMAKNVRADTILHAAKQVQTRYRSALQYAQHFSDARPNTDKLTETIAQAFAAGWKTEDCEQLVPQLKERTRAMNRAEGDKLVEQTMWTARDMARRQVHSSTVSKVLSSALRQSYRAKEMNELRQRFTTQAKKGSPENVAKGFTEGIGRGVAAHQLGEVSAFSNRGRAGGSVGGSGGSGSSTGSGGSSGGSGGGSGGSGGSGGGSGGSGGSGGGSGGSGGDGGGSGGSGRGGGGGGKGR